MKSKPYGKLIIRLMLFKSCKHLSYLNNTEGNQKFGDQAN